MKAFARRLPEMPRPKFKRRLVMGSYVEGTVRQKPSVKMPRYTVAEAVKGSRSYLAWSRMSEVPQVKVSDESPRVKPPRVVVVV